MFPCRVRLGYPVQTRLNTVTLGLKKDYSDSET